MQSQNKEAEVVINYFAGRVRGVLDIGANDGKTFSNSYDLIQLGWHGELLEPGHVFEAAEALYKDTPRIKVHNFGIGLTTENVTFYESQEHLKDGKFDPRLAADAVPSGLVSSMDFEETVKWRNAGIEFNETKIALLSFQDFQKISKYKLFEFISIDTEGNDWTVLQQLSLDELLCECLCIEWNGHQELLKLYSDYCEKFKMKEIYRSAENLIFAL